MYKVGFFDEVHDFQKFIVENIFILGNYTILSEQLTVKSNETGIIDILAVDNDDKQITIIELKNTKTSDKNIWQPIRYYDLLQRGEDSLNELLLFNGFDYKKINKNPKVLMVVPKCTQQLIRSISYFSNIDCKIIEIKKEENEKLKNVTKKTFYPSTINHKEDLSNIVIKQHKEWNLNEYQSVGVNKHKIDICSKMIHLIKNVFKEKGYIFDIFFKETKVLITKNGKTFINMYIKKGYSSHSLSIDFTFKENPNKNDFLYSASVEKYNYENKKIKLTIIDAIDKNLLIKYL